MTAALMNPEPGRCSFFLGARKGRFCRGLSLHGQRFCGNHLQAGDPIAAAVAPLRVPCPLDPYHTVIASELELHVTKRCPALLLAQRERVGLLLRNIFCTRDLPEIVSPPPPTWRPVSTRPNVQASLHSMHLVLLYFLFFRLFSLRRHNHTSLRTPTAVATPSLISSHLCLGVCCNLRQVWLKMMHWQNQTHQQLLLMQHLRQEYQRQRQQGQQRQRACC